MYAFVTYLAHFALAGRKWISLLVLATHIVGTWLFHWR